MHFSIVLILALSLRLLANARPKMLSVLTSQIFSDLLNPPANPVTSSYDISAVHELPCCQLDFASSLAIASLRPQHDPSH